MFVPPHLDIFSHGMDLRFTEVLVSNIPIVVEVYGTKWCSARFGKLQLGPKASSSALEYGHSSIFMAT